MNLDQVQEKAQQKLSELEADYKELKAKAKMAAVDLEIDYKMKLYELQQKLDELGAEAKQYAETGKGSWQIIAEGFDKAAGELSSAFKDAWAKLRE